MLEFVFGDSLDFTPIDATCKIQKSCKAKIIAWASTPDNLLGSYHNQDGFCSGRFELVVSIFPKNTASIAVKFLLEVGASYSELKLTMLGA